MTAVLGVSAYYHDSAAALVVDGRIVAAAQEERFTRKKHDDGFPKNAIAACLDIAGLEPGQLDYVGFYDKPLLKFERLLETYLAYAPLGFRSFLRAMPLWLKRKLHLPREINRGLNRVPAKQVVFAGHHESHAASAFTYFCGFRVNSGEYKLMGLAPHGQPTQADAILEHLIDLKEDGSFRMDMSYFNYQKGLTMTSKKFHRLFGGPPRRPETPLTQREKDLAASIQRVTESAGE